MEFEWLLMRNFLGKTGQEDAVLIGDGVWFALPERSGFPKKEKYSSEFARQRFLEEAAQREVSLGMTEESLEQDAIPDYQKEKTGKLLEELVWERTVFEILAKNLKEN